MTNLPRPLTEEQAANENGIHGRLAMAETREEERVTKAAKELMADEYVRKEHPDLTLEDAKMWAEVLDNGIYYASVTLEEARAINEGRNTSKRMEMTPEFEKHIGDAREKAKAALKQKAEGKEKVKKPQRLEDLMKGKSPEEQKQIKEQAEKNRIIKWLKLALEDNDHFHAYISMEEAISHGIDLSEIIETTKTELDPRTMEKELREEMETKKSDGTIVIDDLPIAMAS